VVVPASTESPSPTATATEEPQRDAHFINRVQPQYPSICIDQGASGRVVVDVTIGPDGSLVSAVLGQTSGFPCIDDAALAAAKESTYEPSEVDGRPATQTYLIVYDFTLDS